LSKIQNDFAKNPLAGVELAIERENNGPPTGKPISIEISGDNLCGLAGFGEKGACGDCEIWDSRNSGVEVRFGDE